MKGKFLVFGLALAGVFAGHGALAQLGNAPKTGVELAKNESSSSILPSEPVAASQNAKEPVAKPAPEDAPPPFYRYEVFATAAYSSANQVKGSAALIGGSFGASAKLKKWFGGTVDFGDYGVEATSHAHVSTSMTTLLAGPEFYVTSDKLTGFLHVMFGGAHTAGVGAMPNISFAYAIGGGLEYAVSRHFSVRASGDGITSSFVLDPNNLGLSAHSRLNARATGGVAYRF